MNDIKSRVCPVEKAGSLDNRLRRWLQNPRKILSPFIKEGMTILDLGCGPGFFTIDIARMAGKNGRVFAADLQEGMLHKLKEKIQGTGLDERITLHKCGEKSIGLSKNMDFVLAFYIIHEVPDQEKLFKEIKSILRPDGRFFIVEPSFHVTKQQFKKTVITAQECGFTVIQRPKVFLSKAVIMKL